MMHKQVHHSVLTEAIVDGLMIQPDGIYIDATFGRGGHSRAVLEHLSSNGQLLALDRDPEAIRVGSALAEQDPRFHIIQRNFNEIRQIATERELSGRVNGIVIDLGVSSPQLDNPERGFSFQKDGPLDMRMNPTQGLTAATWINHAKEQEIIHILLRYGEERLAKKIAAAIITARKLQPITRTLELAKIIKQAVPNYERNKHPATRTFQAIRIFINGELEALETFLQDSLSVLTIGGRLVIISFHSLEDGIVKEFIELHTQGNIPPHIAIPEADIRRQLRRVGKTQHPTQLEIRKNPRARSARLRIAEKIA